MMKKLLILFLFTVISITSYAQVTGTDKILYENNGGTAAGVWTVDQLKTYITAGLSSGTVLGVTVASSNGFAGTSNGSATNPVLTISTTVTGMLKGNGTAISAAVAGTDYVLPTGNISGTAGGLSATLAVSSGGTGATTFTAGYLKASGTSAFTTVSTIPATDITGIHTVAQGGIGVGTITGYMKGNGTSAVTGSATIPTSDLSGTISNAQLTNSVILGALTSTGTDITISGATSLGGTLTLNVPNASATARGVITTGAQTIAGDKSLTGVTTLSTLVKTVGAQITASATLGAADFVRGINSATTITVTVPVSLPIGKIYELPLAQTSTGSVIIATAGSETFNGGSTFTVTANSPGTTIQMIKMSSTNYSVKLTW